ncbi:doublecortin domain-containing protein 2B isoform X2 [Zootoca vivipara]|uniref:doublecortin domain-containing protein 2B isoform X2 n=1 Tax=Zootoca vivipara TaxID=8524 RepID=UPI00293BD504|nr:doublecortin domain-containing protein 2B isoform X2 [Zootoca vivipara]
MSSGTVAVAPVAKNVMVYRNGDPFFHGRKFVVSHRRFLTFEAFLNEVTSTIHAPAAIRSIYTPRHGHRVSDLGELQNGCQYVAGGFERFKRMDYLNPGMRQLNGNQKKDRVQSYPVIPQKMPVSTHWKKQVNLPCIIHDWQWFSRVSGQVLSQPYQELPLVFQLGPSICNPATEPCPFQEEWRAYTHRLCKLNGDAVSTGEDLVSGNYYVAVGLEKYKDLPYFELLVPPKITHQPIRDHSNSRRMSQNRGLPVAKLHLAPQEGSSDSALLEPPQQMNLRRVQSTGIVQKESSWNLSAVTQRKKGRKHPRMEKADSIFHAKPGQARHIRRNSNQNSDQDEGSVYKIKGAREEIQDAQEIRDDENTQVELPLDQKAAETVEEEFVPQSEALQRRKVENTDKLQKAHTIQCSAGDSQEEVTRKPPFHPA